MSSMITRIRRYGLAESTRKAYRLLGRKFKLLGRKSGYTNWRFRKAPRYANPTEAELKEIEAALIGLGVRIESYTADTAQFIAFQAENWFPPNYHGGMGSGVWEEKLLEHWISSERLGLNDFSKIDIFVDVAAAGSPWAQNLHERRGLTAFAIDLCEVGDAYIDLPYYLKEDATKTSFPDASVRGASLHCAYEMFMGEDDTHFITEAARILKPGGKLVILPLYMHTHYCAYSTPEYFGKGYSDPGAKEYVRLDCSCVPSSRKYDAAKLKERVLDPILSAGLRYRLLALRNKAELGQNIYCHFILEVEK